MSDPVRPPTEEGLREATEELLGLMTDYYFHADDPELEAVNRLRRMLGWRQQLPKCCEAELQADIAEGKASATKGVPHAEYHRRLHGSEPARAPGNPGRYDGWGEGYGGSDADDDEGSMR